MTIPGCACATTISRGLDLEEGFGLSATSALTTAGSAASPLVYSFGHSSIGDNAKHFRILIDALAESVKRRMKEDPSAAHAGLIVDTFGQVDSLGHDLLMHAIRAFDVNVVLVMGHERLFAELSRPLKSWRTAGVSEQIRILKLPKSGGVRSLAPSSALPLGEDRKVDETQVVRVDSMDVLVHSILAVVDAEGPEELTKKPALGFIYVSEVDSVKGKLTLVTPCPGRLPRNVLVMGSYKWSDT
ncbi:MAG: hypothetical protein BJ554DRAFT_6745 [Olpidium bornovanus]|uniref:Clp1 C-terminal domain-containing protein n=1 Tax=Olpidium bornovanus TaxID=278681 RepID=A0A8H7ZXI6_9FUNG|nr:MAG: hypothetical protein BJ554DRAFT_6745 [Olpidium bornovanus]